MVSDLTTLQALSAQQDQLAAAQGSVALNLAEDYRALGGGWEIRPSADPVDLLPNEAREEMEYRTDY